MNTGAYSGGFACQVTRNEQGAIQAISGLQPNTTYTLTAWGRLSGEDDVTYIFAKKYGGDVLQSRFTTTTVYSQASLTFTTGATNTSMELGFWKDAGNGSAWVDDFSLTVNPTAPAP